MLREWIISLDWSTIEVIGLTCLVLATGAVLGSIVLLIEAFKN